MGHVVVDWRAKKKLLGKTLASDRNDKIGKIDDIITPENSVSFAIIGVVRRDVPIPIGQIKLRWALSYWPAPPRMRSTRSRPPFEYAKK